MQLGPATPSLLRDLNERTVLESIRAGAPISRAEVARRAGLSKPTVSIALQSLLDAGLVREVGLQSGRPGRGALLFEAVADAGHVLGIDIGARFVRGAVCDLAGEILARRDVELERPTLAAALDAVELLARAVPNGVGGARTVAAVAGSPGVVDPRSGRIWLADLVEGLNGTALGRALEACVGVPVVVENDVNLGALGEHWRGAAIGVDDFAYLSIGSGMGAGIVLGGELHRGRRGAAGEVDFVPFRAVQRPGPDADPSAAGIAAIAADVARRARRPTPLVPPYEVRDVFAHARAGDPVARRVVDRAADTVALYVAAIAAVVDVELVVLGGGIGVNGDLLLAPVAARLADLVPYPPRLAVATLGPSSVLSGALAVGLRTALDRVFVDRPVRERSAS
jgi:predicted NBD/HSP70 family sugar kinase